jgi:NAD(P)-dependent dehydrogenase (short-subunit alcohol dehydrogenase family)
VNAGAEARLAKAMDTFGRLDVVCNNAGIPDHWMPLTEVSDDLWQRNIDVNMTGPFRVCRAAVEIMLKQGHGIIVNVASLAGFRGGRSGLARLYQLGPPTDPLILSRYTELNADHKILVRCPRNPLPESPPPAS